MFSVFAGKASFLVIYFRGQYNLLISHPCTTFDASHSSCSLCAPVLPWQTPSIFTKEEGNGFKNFKLISHQFYHKYVSS